MTKTLACLLLFLFTLPATAEEPIQVMVLGSYHMGNPGQDVHNIQATDVTTDNRQAELEAVAAALAEFEPTVVAVEQVTEPPEYRDPGYERFQPSQLREIPDERVQVGYRLAHAMGLEAVYGIDEQPAGDEPDYFPFGKLQKHVADTGQQEAFSAMSATIGRELGKFEARQETDSIAELLIVANQVLGDASFYYRMLSFDEGEAQPAAELLAYYYMRNAKIFSKLIDVTEPGDRVVVVYGAGHKHWLEHFLRNTPGYQLVDPIPYLRRATRGSDRQ